MNEGLWIGLGTVFATFVGPIAAVLLTRFVDRRREQERRRLDLFRILMRSRRMPLSPDFVGGLNLIEIEFIDHPEVLKAWRTLLENFEGAPAATQQDEARIGQKRDYLRTVLLSQIAKSLRFNIPDLEIFRGGYSPQGHIDAEQEQAIVRRFYVDIALGRKGFPTIPIPQVGAPQQPPLSPPTTENSKDRTF